jgi:hypothetical protein
MHHRDSKHGNPLDLEKVKETAEQTGYTWSTYTLCNANAKGTSHGIKNTLCNAWS